MSNLPRNFNLESAGFDPTENKTSVFDIITNFISWVVTIILTGLILFPLWFSFMILYIGGFFEVFW